MSRQLGFALGVALLVAVLGSPTRPAAVLDAFERGWWLTAGLTAVAALVGLRITSRRPV